MKPVRECGVNLGRHRYHYTAEQDGKRVVLEVGERMHRSIQKLIKEHYSDLPIDDIKFSLPPYQKSKNAKLVPLKGTLDLDRGFVWAPCVPKMKPIPPIENEGFSIRSKMLSRYAHKLVWSDYYGTVSILGDGGYDPKEELPKTVSPPVIKNVIPGTIQSLWQPEPGIATAAIIADPAQYPHKCPRCGSPAYIGFVSVDCSRKACS